MKFRKFEILEKCPGPVSQIPAKHIDFENAHPLVLQFPAKKEVWKIEQLPKSKSVQTATLMFF